MRQFIPTNLISSLIHALPRLLAWESDDNPTQILEERSVVNTYEHALGLNSALFDTKPRATFRLSTPYLTGSSTGDGTPGPGLDSSEPDSE